MTKPEVVLCPDGHYRLIIWELGPYIADYPEQVLLSCIIQGWCAKYGCFLSGFIYYLCFVKDAEPYQDNSTATRTYTTNVQGLTQISYVQGAKWVYYMTIMVLLGM